MYRCASWLALCVAAPAFALTSVEDVKTVQLKNGMQILVLEDHSIPNANMYTFWKVGSRNEAPGITGLSHFFEHMMFNGAKKYGPKQFDRVMEASGGANNAYTTNDVTVYTDWFPASSLDVIFDLEADRIGALTIDPKMVASERGVVASERSTGLENSNWRVLDEEVASVAFRAHTYSIPTIGHESDINAWTQDDLTHYFHTYYSPNNAVVVIVGDVNFADVKAKAERHFGKLKARAKPPLVRTVEPQQQGERRVFVKKASATTPNILIAFKTPATRDDDYYAIDLLQSILSEGRSSRLYQALIEKQIASEQFVMFGESFDPYLLQFAAVANEGVSAAQLEQALLVELERIVSEGVNDNELQKAKNAKLMNFYQQLSTINGTANTLGSYQLFHGDYKKMFSAPAAYQAVSAAQIQTVAKKYLQQSQRTVGVLAAKEE